MNIDAQVRSTGPVDGHTLLEVGLDNFDSIWNSAVHCFRTNSFQHLTCSVYGNDLGMGEPLWPA